MQWPANNVTKVLGLCLFLVISQSLRAQTFSFDIWHQGKVVAVGWDTLSGLVRYNRENFLEIMRNGKVEVHESKRIVSFQIHDQVHKRVRQFYSLPYGETGSNRYFFFELISYGKVTVLSRENVEVRTYSQGSSLAPPKIHSVIDEKYFLWDKHEKILSFRGREKDWSDLFSDRLVQVKSFIKEHKFNFRNKYQLKEIIDFYNSLFNP